MVLVLERLVPVTGLLHVSFRHVLIERAKAPDGGSGAIDFTRQVFSLLPDPNERVILKSYVAHHIISGQFDDDFLQAWLAATEAVH